MVSRLRRAIALLLMVVTLGLASCGGDRDVPVVLLKDGDPTQTAQPIIGAISEVSPPERIQQLKPYLDVYEPQVRIVSPRNDETFESTTVSVELQVRDLPIYKDQDLGLGPHLHLFLDDQPYRAVYNPDEPIIFKDLSPGTHALRVFASRPWHESFKNAGAYDQITFNIFAESPDLHPDDSQALLTYSRPQGSYGAEPIMLDFYLTNAPLHIVAQEDESVTDWRIRCTVNGESFVFDRWQPIYLKGFKPGKNWVKLELIDANGNVIDNAFNTGLRVIEYTPGGDDGLSRLIRGEIPLSQAKVLVDPNYAPPAPVVQAEPTPAAPAAAVPEETAPAAEAPPPTEVAPAAPAAPAEEPTPAAAPDEEKETPVEPTAPVDEIAPAKPEAPTTQKPESKPKQSLPMPAPEPTAEPGMLPEIMEAPPRPAPELAPVPKPEDRAAPSTTAAPATQEPTAQPPAGLEEPPLVVPDAVEEVAPPSAPAATPVPEPPNSMESRPQKQSRSRFSRDRLLRRNSPEREPEPAIVPEAEPQSPTTQPIPDTEPPRESIQSAENVPQVETTTPSDESSSTSPDQQTLAPAPEINTAPESSNFPEEDDSALESLEEEADVI